MLNFIDISSHQGDINLSHLGIDAVIVKATQGVDYVNPFCDPKVQQAISLGLKWGFYHFAGANSPIAEAEFFINACDGYFGHGIPVLDWEGVHDEDGNLVFDQPVEWVNEFVRVVHERTGVWPWIYGNPWRFNQGGVEPECARWVASYPDLWHPNFLCAAGNPPECDGLVAAWQFASDGRLDGFDRDLDLNHFYGDGHAWDLYAGIDGNHSSTPHDDEVQRTVLENEQFKVTIERKG